jgi:hypothetical protein
MYIELITLAQLHEHATLVQGHAQGHTTHKVTTHEVMALLYNAPRSGLTLQCLCQCKHVEDFNVILTYFWLAFLPEWRRLWDFPCCPRDEE